MPRFLLCSILLSLSIPAPSSAADASIPLTLEITGVSNASLSATPMTRSIDMELTAVTNQLALTLAITPGTSTAIIVKCYESSNNSTWAQIGLCDSATPTSACAPDAREFTLANYASTAGGQKIIATRWDVKQRFAKCSAYDAGTGKISITGSRSWQ
jgi:hypothetical protein